MRVDEEWRSFCAAVMPVTAPNNQVEDMKNSFYAGAFTVLERLEAISGPGWTEEQGTAALHALRIEVAAYMGRAVAKSAGKG